MRSAGSAEGWRQRVGYLVGLKQTILKLAGPGHSSTSSSYSGSRWITLTLDILSPNGCSVESGLATGQALWDIYQHVGGPPAQSIQIRTIRGRFQSSTHLNSLDIPPIPQWTFIWISHAQPSVGGEQFGSTKSRFWQVLCLSSFLKATAGGSALATGEATAAWVSPWLGSPRRSRSRSTMYITDIHV